jgi:hypothetical protein
MASEFATKSGLLLAAFEDEQVGPSICDIIIRAHGARLDPRGQARHVQLRRDMFWDALPHNLRRRSHYIYFEARRCAREVRSSSAGRLHVATTARTNLCARREGC